jgi:pimeloyl-ACP methyl ester carboxylesterase
VVYRRAALLYAVALALTGCGGGNDDAAERAATSAPVAGSPAFREVTAGVAGGTLSGHCRGTQKGGPAVVLEVGMAADANQNRLAVLEEDLAQRTVVCAYDRAGVGASDSPPKTPRPLSDVVADLEAFIAAAKLEPPHFLVGFSAGGVFVFRYAQAHPDTVAGFVSMNPVPPAETFLPMARKVESKDEFESELAFFHRGENEEEIIFTETERMLTDPLPPTMPYAVMFDEDCGGDTEFCQRILPPLTRATKMLVSVGASGRFVRAKGAGHNIFETDSELVLKTIDDVLKDAADG